MSRTATQAIAKKDELESIAHKADEAFYKAKHDLFFCTEVVKLAAMATAMQRSLRQIDHAGGHYPDELKKLKAVCDGVDEWEEMPSESLHWALSFAAQRIDDAVSTMETAFMAAQAAGGAA
jgi:hypothetical protein